MNPLGAVDAGGVALLWLDGEEARIELLDVDEGGATTRSSASVSAEEDLDAAVRSLLGGREAAAPGDGGASRPSEWNWVIGGALVAGGIGALISPIATLAVLDPCSDSPVP